MTSAFSQVTIKGVEHHRVSVNGTELHYVSAGTGSPVLLVHGFPESWWVFHKLIPILSEQHQVVAVDLRGFGDSATDDGTYDSATSAADLRDLITQLDVGPMHLTGQDISGPTTYRLAARHPELVRSYAAIETGLPGFGLEMLADVSHGGSWHIGALATPGIPEMPFAGRERLLIEQHFIPGLSFTDRAFTNVDIDELVRVYSRPNGFRGAIGLYTSMLTEAAAITELAASKLEMPVLAVAGFSGDFTAATMRNVAIDVIAVKIDGIGHYVAMEAPHQLGEALNTFYRAIDKRE